MHTKTLWIQDEPIPEPLRGAELGTFAHYTVTVRMPRILRDTLEQEDFSPQAEQRLRDLLAELPHGSIRFLHDPQAPDLAAWNAAIEPYLGLNWLQAPWFFAETYFYRRIVEASGYFEPGDGQGRDPYARQKRLGLQESAPALGALCRRMEAMLAAAEHGEQGLAGLLRLGVRGNQADLSMWPAGGSSRDETAANQGEQGGLLVDDSEAVLAYLAAARPARVDFILDNAGLELAVDLGTADVLLASGLARQVVFHLKAHPTFVSDAVREDAAEAVRFLAGLDEPAAAPMAAHLAQRLQAHLDGGRLLLGEHFFWTSPLPAWEMPADLRGELAASSLLIFKGDANYRRLLGDRHWPPTAPFAAIVQGAPAPLAALRVLKSEVVAGLAEGQAQALAARQPGWMTSGRWGLVQAAGL